MEHCPTGPADRPHADKANSTKAVRLKRLGGKIPARIQSLWRFSQDNDTT